MIGRPHVVIINRWRASYAEYGRYLDHRRYAVTYVTTEVGSAGAAPGAAEVAVVERTDDLDPVRRCIEGLAVRHGRVSRVVALKEDDLGVAAQLAVEHGCAVRPPEELVVFRDKFAMAQAVGQAGLAVPPFAVAIDEAAVRRFGAVHGWPLVLKPRTGSASEGVVLVDSPGTLAATAGRLGPHMLVQAHVGLPVHHIDGVFDGHRLGPWRASRYVNSCLGFRTGTPLGSVEQDCPHLTRALGSFARLTLKALTDRPTAFHLEVFAGGRQDDPQISFLEVGARVGGSEIPFLWREVHGYDLMEAAFRISMGGDPPGWEKSDFDQVAGWLLLPAPAARPCRIVEAKSMLGRAPGPYAEEMLQPGEVVPDADAYYEHVGARFRFRGPTSSWVEAAVLATARGGCVRGESLPPPVVPPLLRKVGL